MKYVGLTIMTAVALASAAIRAQDAQGGTQDAAGGGQPQLATTATADTTSATSGKPYDTIVARNVFGLLPIPPPDPEADKPPVDPPPKITPTGIMTIFGRDQALFKAAPKPKPGQPPKDVAYVLAEGERQDDIEVTKIDHVNGKITFNNHGTIQELALVPASDSTGGGSGGGPGVPAVPGGIPRPNVMSAADRAAMFRARMSGRPTAQQAPLPGSTTFQSSGGSGATTFNSSSSGAPQSEAAIEDQVMQAAHDIAQIEQNRIDTQQMVDEGKMPPLPPTQMTPEDARGVGGAPLIQSMTPQRP